MVELEKLFPNKEMTSTTQLLNIWGNHEMYNFNRNDLANTPLNTSVVLGQNQVPKTNCYIYDVSKKLRLICLDFYKFSILGYEEKDTDYLEALKLIQAHNKNENLNNSEGLRGHALRFCKFNGK